MKLGTSRVGRYSSMGAAAFNVVADAHPKTSGHHVVPSSGDTSCTFWCRVALASLLVRVD